MVIIICVYYCIISDCMKKNLMLKWVKLNLNENRVTDHRIHYSSTDLLGILKGGHLLDDFIQKLQDESRKESLVEMLEEFKAKNLWC
jgi:hypothetical protein